MSETASPAATLYLLKPIRASSDSVWRPTFGGLSIPMTHSSASVSFRERLFPRADKHSASTQPPDRGESELRQLEDPALGLVYPVVVDRGVAPLHQAVLVELPQFITVTSPPLPLCIVALVLEPDRNAVSREAPEVLL